MSALFDKAHRPILAIMSALVIWGSLHALGAYLFEHDYRKPLVVYGFMLAFLGFWAVMLASRSRRIRRQRWEAAGGNAEEDTDANLNMRHRNE